MQKNKSLILKFDDYLINKETQFWDLDEKKYKKHEFYVKTIANAQSKSNKILFAIESRKLY